MIIHCEKYIFDFKINKIYNLKIESTYLSQKDNHLKRSEFSSKLIEEAKLKINDQHDVSTNLKMLKSIDVSCTYSYLGNDSWKR